VRKRNLFLIAALLAAGLLLAACGGGRAIEGPGMIYFYLDTCHICQGMSPIVDDLEAEYGDEFNIVRANVGTDRGKDLADEYGIIGQPSYIFFNETGEEVRRMSGAREYQVLATQIERLMGAQDE
jgi:thioredoxin 1